MRMKTRQSSVGASSKLPRFGGIGQQLLTSDLLCIFIKASEHSSHTGFTRHRDISSSITSYSDCWLEYQPM